MEDSEPRLSILFGPRRGVVRSVRERLLVGRAPEADLQLIDERVSREHCVFERRGREVVLRDLGSRNGTWVNGQRLDGSRTLRADDAVGIGETLLVFGTDVEPALARDGASTLVLSRAETSASTSATSPALEPDERAWAAAGRLLLATAAASGPDEAADRLAKAVASALGCDEVLVCGRSPEGVLVPWLGCPRGLTLTVHRGLAELALGAQRAVSVEGLQARARTDAETTCLERRRAALLCAPLGRASGGAASLEPGVLFAVRARPFDAGELALATLLARALPAQLQGGAPRPALGLAGRSERGAPTLEAAQDEPVAASPSMCRAVALARQVAPSSATVLVTGERGTGKEELARLVHRASRRSDGPFVAINCGAIPASLAESELFGHERGAFTGALREHLGAFERADGGTLFLDEVGELPPLVQVKLLRILEERAVLRVGGRAPRPVDVRLVAATNRVLEAEVKEGRFRADLLWRLDVVRIALDPLRARSDDIGPLAERLLARHARAQDRSPPPVADDALDALRAFAWPGNVRQLSNVLERALVLKADDGPLTLADLPAELARAPGASAPDAASGGASDAAAPVARAALQAPPRTLGELVAELEREQLLLARRRSGGVKARAAAQLGISRPTLDRKLAEHRLQWSGDAE